MLRCVLESLLNQKAVVDMYDKTLEAFRIKTSESALDALARLTVSFPCHLSLIRPASPLQTH